MKKEICVHHLLMFSVVQLSQCNCYLCVDGIVVSTWQSFFSFHVSKVLIALVVLTVLKIEGKAVTGNTCPCPLDKSLLTELCTRSSETRNVTFQAKNNIVSKLKTLYLDLIKLFYLNYCAILGFSAQRVAEESDWCIRSKRHQAAVAIKAPNQQGNEGEKIVES